MNIIEIHGLSRSFGTRQILNSVDLTLQKGEFVSIIGKSGSGKSTLINIIGLLDAGFTGSYQLLGEDVIKLTPKQCAKIRNQQLGFVFQMYQLINNYTVKDNILLPVLYSKEKTVDDAYYRCLLETLQIVHLEHTMTVNLSGGEKQRVAIARAAINRPSLIIADEPTGNLDAENTEKVMTMFHYLTQQDVSVIMVSHDSDAASQADRILKLEGGKLI